MSSSGHPKRSSSSITCLFASASHKNILPITYLLTYLLLDACSQYTLLRTTKFECTWLGRYSSGWRTQKDHLPCLQPTDLSGQPAESFPHISQRLYRTLGEQLPIHRKTKLPSYRFSEPLLT